MNDTVCVYCVVIKQAEQYISFYFLFTMLFCKKETSYVFLWIINLKKFVKWTDWNVTIASTLQWRNSIIQTNLRINLRFVWIIESYFLKYYLWLEIQGQNFIWYSKLLKKNILSTIADQERNRYIVSTDYRLNKSKQNKEY